MSRLSSRALAPAAAAILFSLAVGACASSGGADSAKADAAPSVATAAAPQASDDMATPQATAPGAAAPVSPTSPVPSASPFSEAQIQSFARASVEVDTIQARHRAGMSSGTAEQQAAARQAMGAELAAALQRHGIDPATYNNIARTASSDPALAQRITTLRAQAGAPG